MISEAACELFLEQGYAQTSAAQIAQRAGVSRSTFFNYFPSKADVFWAGVDACVQRVSVSLAAADDEQTVAAANVQEVVVDSFSDLTPDALALALVHAEAMGVADELARDLAWRQSVLAHMLSHALARQGLAPLAADVHAAAWAGSVFAAVRAWAREGPGTAPLKAVLHEALDIAGSDIHAHAAARQASSA